MPNSCVFLLGNVLLDGWICRNSYESEETSCRLKRSNRACLICPGRMDLVEVRQTMGCLFFSLVNTKTMNLLDCPSCGFATTVESYDYIRICQPGGKLIDDSSRSDANSDDETPIFCGSCRSKVAPHWQFCPECGSKQIRSERIRRLVRFNLAKKALPAPPLPTTTMKSSKNTYQGQNDYAPFDETKEDSAIAYQAQ